MATMKLVDADVLDATFSEIADSIRAKKDTTAVFSPEQMAEEISGIVTVDDLLNAEESKFGTEDKEYVRPAQYEHGMVSIASTDTVASTGNQPQGNKFTLNENIVLWGFRFFNNTTDDATTLSLFDASSKETIASAIVATKSGTGWKDYVVDEPILLKDGRQYIVSFKEGFWWFGNPQIVWNEKFSGTQYVQGGEGATFPDKTITTTPQRYAAIDILMGPTGETGETISEFKIQAETMTDLADAVKDKAGLSGMLTPAQITEAVQGLTVGGVVLTENMGIYYKGKAESETDFSGWNVTSTAIGFLPPYTAACYDPNGGTATSLTGTIEAKAGDWILATVTTRSETTFPEDWTVLYQSGVIGNNLRMAMLCRQVSADETVSFTVSQTDNARIYINLMAVGGINGFAYHGDFYETTDSVTSAIMTRPDYGCVIWACTANLWTSATPYPSWSCANLIAVDLGGTAQPRQANFWDEYAVATRTFVAPGGTSMGIACVEVLRG